MWQLFKIVLVYKGGFFINTLIMEDVELNFIWESIQNSQLIFHPDIAPDGQFDFKKFYQTKSKKDMILFLDRNVLSSLIRLCKEGKLEDKEETQLVGMIMVWALMNNIPISAGAAIQEYATKINSQQDALEELKIFLNIFDYYPSQMWLDIACGRLNEIPILQKLQDIDDVTAVYNQGTDHYYMTYATMLHIVLLLRKKDFTPADRFINLLDWTFDNLLICQYTLVYAAMLFTNQENIKAPKAAFSNDINKVISGCKNQSWDITYLSSWSVFYMNPDEYPEEFFFTTNDILLKRIFINTHGFEGVNGLLWEVFSKKDYNRIIDRYQLRIQSRNKPKFGDNPIDYPELPEMILTQSL